MCPNSPTLSYKNNRISPAGVIDTFCQINANEISHFITYYLATVIQLNVNWACWSKGLARFERAPTISLGWIHTLLIFGQPFLSCDFDFSTLKLDGEKDN